MDKKAFEDLTPEEREKVFIEYASEDLPSKTIQGYVSGLKQEFPNSIVAQIKPNTTFFELNNLEDVKAVDELFKYKGKPCRIHQILL